MPFVLLVESRNGFVTKFLRQEARGKRIQDMKTNPFQRGNESTAIASSRSGTIDAGVRDGKMPWRRVRLFSGRLCLTLGFLLLLASISDTAMARKRPTWQPVDYAQENCVNMGSPYSDRTTYYGVYIKGRWTRSINAGVTSAPSGSTFWGSYLPIPPGSSEGEYSLAYVALQVAPGTPLGTYAVDLWADDGPTRQTVPVTLIVADRCGY